MEQSKIGDRANASSEVEYSDAWAEMLGPPGRGIQTILTMVHHTRLDCIVGSAGLVRRCVLEALHHTHHRKVPAHLLLPMCVRVCLLIGLHGELRSSSDHPEMVSLPNTGQLLDCG